MPDGTSCGTGAACQDGGCEPQLTLAVVTGASAAGSGFSGTLATLTDLIASDTPANVTVSIDWGDGATSTAMVTGGAGSFAISGSHSYATNGLMNAIVSVSDPATGASVQANVTIGVGVSELAAAGQAEGLVTGPDGNLWVTLIAANAVARVTPEGAVTSFALPTATATPEAIVVGPDNNLWFSELSARHIGRITLDGTITEFSAPSLGDSDEISGGRQGICAGADGNIWFVEDYANNIGQMTLDGVVTEFPIPTTNAQPGAITPGPDGNVWFTEFNASKVARITPAGAITEFALDPSITPGAILAGPDGNIWVAEALPLGRMPGVGQMLVLQQMTTTGTILASVTVPGNVEALATGSDGNIWLAFGVKKIGRMTPGGTLTLYPFGVEVLDLAAGPASSSSAIWFTAEGSADVGSFSP